MRPSAAEFGDQAGNVVAGDARRELNEPDRIGEKKKHARHAEQREGEHDETRRDCGRDQKIGAEHGQNHQRKRQHQAGAAWPLASVIC